MRMPWGKYRGYELESLPDDYLWWLYGRDLMSNWDLSEEVSCMVHDRFPEKFTVYSSPMVQSHGINPDDINRIYRKLAAKWHPDRGGTTAAMQALNDFKMELLEG